MLRSYQSPSCTVVRENWEIEKIRAEVKARWNRLQTETARTFGPGQTEGWVGIILQERSWKAQWREERSWPEAEGKGNSNIWSKQQAKIVGGGVI